MLMHYISEVNGCEATDYPGAEAHAQWYNLVYFYSKKIVDAIFIIFIY